jgi:cell division septal protein FtsQ
MVVKMADRRKTKGRANNQQTAEHPRRRRRRLSGFAYFLLVITILAVGGALSAIYFMRIDSIAVSGKTQYTAAQIIDASGIRPGQHIFLTDHAGAAAELCRKLPFIESAKVIYRPFTGIDIEVKPNTAVYDVAYKGGYAALDKNFKVLETSTDPSKFRGLPVISGTQLSDAVPGLRLSEKNLSQVMQAQAIINGLKKNQIDKITDINVADDFELRANYDGRIDILIGTSSDLSFKLKFAAYLLKNKSNISDDDKGLLDVSQSAQSNKASFIPS